MLLYSALTVGMHSFFFCNEELNVERAIDKWRMHDSVYKAMRQSFYCSLLAGV